MPSLCERIAAPLVELHRRTTPPAATVLLAMVGVGIAAYGLLANHSPHVLWAGVLIMVVGWYGFLLSGCERLLAAKDRELDALRAKQERQA